MPQVTLDAQGKLALPADFLERRQMLAPTSYWLDEREGELILHPRVVDVRKLYVEATTNCNLSCRTCIRNVWEDPTEAMTAATFQELLRSLDGLPHLERVVFTGFGEPLSHPDILGMIQAVRERGLSVSVGSNGLLMTTAVAKELVRLGVDRIWCRWMACGPRRTRECAARSSRRCWRTSEG
jgi:molybdenum cofactor biosynthesis enzyme MoaA